MQYSSVDDWNCDSSMTNTKYSSMGIMVLAISSLFVSMQSSALAVSENTNEVLTTDGVKHIIPLDKIRSGGPPRDGIPSIDNPKFVNANEAEFVSDNDVVIGLEINGEIKAYPLSILVWHEIVNDNVGDIPVVVTYCPLCFTNQVFERTIDGNEVEFGTSGKLYNSNLVMYDRLTESYWSQALGTAIVGELAGLELNKIPFDVITWKDWKTLHPDSLVLTTDTGHLRPYGVDPYGSYYTDPRILFPVENKDDRLPPKSLIVGFHQGNSYKAYNQKDVEASHVINDKIFDKSILLISQFSGNTRAFDRTINDQVLEFDYLEEKLIDLQTKSEWSYEGIAISGPLKGTELIRMTIEPGFWFAWAAFHPDTDLFGDVRN